MKSGVRGGFHACNVCRPVIAPISISMMPIETSYVGCIRAMSTLPIVGKAVCAMPPRPIELHHRFVILLEVAIKRHQPVAGPDIRRLLV